MIKGLSERRRFSRGGKIRLGQKALSAKSGKEYPEKSDHFIFDPEDESLRPQFVELFGDKPRRLKVAFASEDPEVVFPQDYKCYSASGLLCKGNGERASRVITGQAELVEVECPSPEHCDYALARGVHGKPGCKQVASLSFFLPDLPVMQVWQIDTSSYNSIININSQLDVLRRVAGRISFLPVDLVLKPQEATNPDTKKKVIIYVLDLVVGVGLRQIGMLKPLDAQLTGPSDAPQLTGPVGPVGPIGPVECPPPSEALPDDLYARSQVAPAPVEADTETGEIIEADTETGEIIEAETVPTLADDPEVQAAMQGMSPAKQHALLASAETGGWDKAMLLDICSKHGTTATPKPAAIPTTARPVVEPVTAKPAAAPAATQPPTTQPTTTKQPPLF